MGDLVSASSSTVFLIERFWTYSRDACITVKTQKPGKLRLVGKRVKTIISKSFKLKVTYQPELYLIRRKNHIHNYTEYNQQ